MVIPFIDDFLNKITMYRLTFYSLIFLWVVGLVLSCFSLLPFAPAALFFSLVVIFITCVVVNKIFSVIFSAPSNTESTYITAFILSLIVGPEITLGNLIMLILVSTLAIASKYLITIHKKHIFNPAAFSIVAGTYILNYYPSWWVGDLYLLPFVVVVGFLMTRKLQKWDLVISFLLVFTIISLGKNIFSLHHSILILENLFVYSSIPFFTFVMLVEPQTTPPTRTLQIAYASLIAFLQGPFMYLGFTSELALVAGNIFSYLVSPKEKLILTLKEARKISKSVLEFAFQSNKKLSFKPGQYLEWTLAHQKRDNRGMRRYFTIASSPTEQDFKIGVKFYENPSSYKAALKSLHQGDGIVASQLAGDFTLPKATDQKLVFLAGGIGVTPFRSMVKYLLDSNEKRDIVMLYSNKNFGDIAYKEIFDQAQKSLGISTVYTLEDAVGIPDNFYYEKGIITEQLIKKYVADFQERIFYISGPKSMVDAFKKILKNMGVHAYHIKTDFFPGFA